MRINFRVVDVSTKTVNYVTQVFQTVTQHAIKIPQTTHNQVSKSTPTGIHATSKVGTNLRTKRLAWTRTKKYFHVRDVESTGSDSSSVEWNENMKIDRTYIPYYECYHQQNPWTQHKISNRKTRHNHR